MTSPVLGNTTTTGENPAGPLDGSEWIRGVQSGGNVKMTAAAIAKLGYSPPTSALGDLIVHGDVGDQRLPVGVDGTQLVPDSTQPLGIKWHDVVGDLRTQFATTAGAGMTGFVQAGSGAVARTTQDELRMTVRPEQFGAKGNGLVDDTAALNAMATILGAGKLYYNAVFEGTYLTSSQFVFTNLINCSFDMRGAAFVGGSVSASYDSVVKFVNAENFKIHGAWTVTADSHFTGPTRNPNLYANGVYFTTAPGGPFTAILSYIDVYGLTTHHCLNGLRIGEYNNDSQMSEFNVHGLMTPFCPSGVIVGGSQAVITFNGCTIGSFTPTDSLAALTPTVFQALQVEGSDVTVVGGELIYFSAASGNTSVNINPASSTTYGNPYGSVQVIGAEIETVTTMAKISNPRGLATPLMTLSGFSMTNCKGYFGALPAASVDVVTVTDSTWAGTISIPDGNIFYFNAGTRTAPTINASAAPNAKISVGKNAFISSSGFPDWMAGVSGGKLTHALELGFYAFATTGTNPSGSGVSVKWTSKSAGAYARYAAMLDLTTGSITVPAGGLRTLQIKACLNVSTANNLGNVYLQDVTAGSIYAFGVIAGGLAILDVTIPDAVAGHVYAVFLNVPAVVTWNGATANSLNVYAAN